MARKRREANIDIGPLLDMVFILLIFFVVTSTFTRETGV
jgi:biopolymer transport protein ExbD